MSITSQSETLAKIRSKQMLELLAAGKRVDGRDFYSYREIKVEPNFIEKAEGSALVTLGKTKVLVGIKGEVGEPYPDTPNNGVLIVNSEFVPLAHELFEPGPPDENSVGLARVVDRGIRESKCIETGKLVLVPGKKVYLIFVDVYILNHGGNLIDASAFASLVALLNTKLPIFEVTESGDVVKKEGEEMPLPIKDHPISTTFVKIGDTIVVDPTLEEEIIASSKLTISFTDDEKVCAVQKSGIGLFTPEEINKATEVALEKSTENRKKLTVFKREEN
ncbi:MAG: exosome complex protein Rrp42 [Candidatus Bathyarchaeota archaeon]